MFALIQSENHASNKGKTAGRYQFDTNPNGIGLKVLISTLDGAVIRTGNTEIIL